MKIGVLTGGGDVQALNAVIASVVKAGITSGHEIVGFEYGWEGALNPMLYRTLDMKAVRGISHTGGTILRTVNKGRFTSKVGEGAKDEIPMETKKMAKENLEKIGVEALIVVGGDGTLGGALQMADLGVKVIGVPKTIDNDIMTTDKTFGFSTAVDIVTDSLDKIHTTATSHDRVILVEVMGRNTGWIGLYSGLAGGADMILIPEIDFDYNKVIEFLRHRKETGYRSSIVVVSEGAKAKNEGLSVLESDAKVRQEVRFGGISQHIMTVIDKMAPGEFELRNTVLGHVQRGGSPNAEDRTLAKAYGVAAIDAINEGKYNTMVAIIGSEIKFVPLADAIDQLKKVTKENIYFKAAKKLGVSFGD